MKKYRVNRTFTQCQFQIVEANSTEEAEQIARDKQENFEYYWNSDEEWDYTVGKYPLIGIKDIEEE